MTTHTEYFAAFDELAEGAPDVDSFAIKTIQLTRIARALERIARIMEAKA